MTFNVEKIAKIWVEADMETLIESYARNFSGNYYGKIVDFSILKARLEYMKQNQSNRELTIIDSLQQANKIAMRFRWQANDLHVGQLDLHCAVFFELDQKQKICKGWAFADSHVDYST